MADPEPLPAPPATTPPAPSARTARVGIGRRASIAAAALAVPLVAAFLIEATDRPLFARVVTEGRAARAAFAIRDDVSSFEKWGTRGFTKPHLDAAYDEVVYVTQDGRTDEARDRAAALAAVERLADGHASVDLFFLAHTNSYILWFAGMSPERLARVRLVYDTGCYNAVRTGPAWITLGARTFVGHPGASQSPVFYVAFLRRWVRGAEVVEATVESNRRMRRTLSVASFCSFGSFDAEWVYGESEGVIFGDAGVSIR